MANHNALSSPSILVIAGHDPSGGAGIVADLRMISKYSLKASSTITALTLQTDDRFYSFEAVSPEVVQNQITIALNSNNIRAVKIGMVANDKNAAAIAKALYEWRRKDSRNFIIYDPVIMSSSGGSLFDGEIAALEQIFTICDLVTPNINEVPYCSMYKGNLLVKGGHNDISSQYITDLLFVNGNCNEITKPRIPNGEKMRGTGCSLASAIACEILLESRNGDLLPPVTKAIDRVREIISCYEHLPLT